MRQPLYVDGVRMITTTALWALVGAAAFALTDDTDVADAICVGWLLAYAVMMAMLSRPGSRMPAIFGVGLAVFAVFGYAYAAMMGVGSGTD